MTLLWYKNKCKDIDFIFKKLKQNSKYADSINGVYYEFDNIYKYDNKKTNHQELFFYKQDILKVLSINSVYQGKLKI